ncbi:hypothetical protein [Dokdonella ginsengisoli]|uniref:Secreted protein n=1 Tax=Dokdonella ginsengisoli TaxID=363846 RepID=A0ABV9R0I1_9GAMM
MSKTSLSLALATALAGIVSMPAAIAGTPSGAFSIFKNCPYTNPSVTTCLYNVVSSGSFVIGNTTLPITSPITLQGGLESVGPSPLYDAVGAPTLASVPAKVPGGLLGIANPAPDWPFPLWVAFWSIVNSVNDVTATIELVDTVQTNFLQALYPPAPDSGEDPVAARLTVRVHLQNPFLGGTCYIGSPQNPIRINLQTATTNPPPPNQPISGEPGNSYYVWVDEANYVGYIQDDDNSLVDNSFAVPGASGCGNVALGLPIITSVLDFLVSGAVNLKVGLPSAAGKNTAIMSGDTSLAASAYVLASEQ